MQSRTLQTMIATALFAAAPLAFAQNTPQTPPSNAGSEPMMHQQTQNQMQKQPASTMRKHQQSMQSMQSGMMGSHMMPGTVTSVDHKTGIVKLKSAGMNLRVHFPPPTITRLKKGDKISLHLAYKMTGQMGGNGQ